MLLSSLSAAASLPPPLQHWSLPESQPQTLRADSVASMFAAAERGGSTAGLHISGPCDLGTFPVPSHVIRKVQ